MNRTELITFDLDGTLLDTAQDFLFAVNQLRSKYDLSPCDPNEIRSRVSEGAVSLARFALNLNYKNEKQIEFHRKELLKIYESCCLENTVPFDGIIELLEEINSSGLAWGIVTNKPIKFATRIVDHFLSQYKPNFLVCPESTGERKPNPAGLVKACKLVNSKPSLSYYIGDHLIDIQAGKRAKMITIAAAYGYIPPGQSPLDWNAEYIAETPIQIKSFIPELSK